MFQPIKQFFHSFFIFKLLKKLKSFLLGIFGDIKLYVWPMWVIYCPDGYRVKGTHTRAAMKLIRPGDIVQRRYVHYADGIFIPGKYSHSGLYIGKGKVIHAIAEGISEIDLIDFMRCDGFRIVRPCEGQAEAVKRAHDYLGTPYDFSFKDGDQSIYCHELIACCYPKLNIPKFQPSLFGLTFGFDKCYLAESFDTEDFKLIYEYYPFKSKKK